MEFFCFFFVLIFFSFFLSWCPIFYFLVFFSFLMNVCILFYFCCRSEQVIGIWCNSHYALKWNFLYFNQIVYDWLNQSRNAYVITMWNTKGIHNLIYEIIDNLFKLAVYYSIIEIIKTHCCHSSRVVSLFSSLHIETD